MQEIFKELACKFAQVKFLKSISTLCIQNFPDQNLPVVFVYYNGQLVRQLIGPMIFGTEKITFDGILWLYSLEKIVIVIIAITFTNTEVEWILSTTGAVTTTLEKDPREKVQSNRKYYEQFESDSE